MRKALSLVLVVSIIFSVLSCKTKSDIDYMQNIKEVAIQESIKNSNLTIQPGDQLVILVSARDNDVVRPFNENYSSSEISQFSTSSSNLPMQGQKTITGPTYLVDSNNNIQFPILGVINTKNKTIDELKEELIQGISKYVKNPYVSIKNSNFKVTVLGEVNRAGAYVMPDGQSMTILNVLGLAGDLTIYGLRKNVLVVRNVDGVISSEYVDLTDAEFIKSPYYFVKQNDVIYVSPNNARKNSSTYGPQASVLISIASVVVGLMAIIFR